MSTNRIVNFKVLGNDRIAPSVYRLTLMGDTSHITEPGQFVNVAVDGMYLRRPISVCDLEDDKLTLIYKVVGKGTEIMSRWRSGSSVNILSGLGNGYDISLAGERPVLIGGGVGIPPLYLLAKKLKELRPTVILGFNTKEEIFLKEEFIRLGCDVKVATVDGSYGIKGYVSEAADGDYTHFYACGPLPMLKAVASRMTCGGSVSMEERMGCGFGACMGCSIVTKNGIKRVCKDGPVFDAKEIIW